MKKSLILNDNYLIKIIRNIFAVVVLCVVCDAYSKDMFDHPANQPVANAPMTGTTPTRQSPAQSPTAPARSSSQQPTAQEIESVYSQILNLPFPLNAQQQTFVNSWWPYFDVTKQNALNASYTQKQKNYLALHPQPTVTNVPSAMGAAVPVEEKGSSLEELASEALGGAKTRASAGLGWGWDKAKQAYNYVTSAPGNLWNYQSSLGEGTKLTAAAVAAGTAPYIAATTATGGTFAAAAAVGYGLTTFIDRLEYRFQSGHWTEKGALNFEILRLEELLANSIVYPTFSRRIAALNDPSALITSAAQAGDPFGVSQKARVILRKKYENVLRAMSDKSFELLVEEWVNYFNVNCGYIAKDFESITDKTQKRQYLENYINRITLYALANTPGTIAQMVATVSEYYRALGLREELNKKP